MLSIEELNKKLLENKQQFMELKLQLEELHLENREQMIRNIIAKDKFSSYFNVETVPAKPNKGGYIVSIGKSNVFINNDWSYKRAKHRLYSWLTNEISDDSIREFVNIDLELKLEELLGDKYDVEHIYYDNSNYVHLTIKNKSTNKLLILDFKYYPNVDKFNNLRPKSENKFITYDKPKVYFNDFKCGFYLNFSQGLSPLKQLPKYIDEMVSLIESVKISF